MIEHLPQSVRDELHAARTKATIQKTRLRVVVGDKSYGVVRMTGTGFALDLADAPNLRGLVNIYDGARHVSQCLVIAAHVEAGQMVYDFKRNTAAGDKAPLDFEQAEFVPAGLIAR